MLNNKLKAVFVIACTASSFTPASAAIEKNFTPYLGGQTQQGITYKGQHDLKTEKGISGTAFGGVRFNKHFGLELGYSFLPKAKIKTVEGVLNKTLLKAKNRNIHIEMTGSYPVRAGFELFGSVGVGYLSSKLTGYQAITQEQKSPPSYVNDGQIWTDHGERYFDYSDGVSHSYFDRTTGLVHLADDEDEYYYRGVLIQGGPYDGPVIGARKVDGYVIGKTKQRTPLSSKSRKFGIRLGLGAQYAFDEHLSARLMFHYQKGNKIIKHFTAAGLGLLYQF